MIYRIFADATVIVHFAYVAFVVFAVPAILIGGWRRWNWVRNLWFRLIHVSMILVVVAEAWAGITCPLTTLENEFRGAAGDATYKGDFVGNFVHQMLFFEAPPWVFTVCYSLFGLLVLATFWFVPPKWKRREKVGRASESLNSGLENAS